MDELTLTTAHDAANRKFAERMAQELDCSVERALAAIRNLTARGLITRMEAQHEQH